MEMLQAILITIILAAWLCLSVTFLVTTIMSLVYDHKREKREKEQTARDLEYHKKRMEALEK